MCVLFYKLGYLKFSFNIIVMRFFFLINFLFKFLCKWMSDVGSKFDNNYANETFLEQREVNLKM